MASSGDASPTLPSNIATPRRKAPWRCAIRPYPVKPLFQRRWARRHPAHSVEDGQRSPKAADSAPAGELVQASTRTYGAQADGGLPAKAKSNVSDRRPARPWSLATLKSTRQPSGSGWRNERMRSRAPIAPNPIPRQLRAGPGAWIKTSSSSLRSNASSIGQGRRIPKPVSAVSDLRGLPPDRDLTMSPHASDHPWARLNTTAECAIPQPTPRKSQVSNGSQDRSPPKRYRYRLRQGLRTEIGSRVVEMKLHDTWRDTHDRSRRLHRFATSGP